MNGRNRAPAYTTARLLHWITALLILAMIPLGVVIVNEWGGPLQDSFCGDARVGCRIGLFRRERHLGRVARPWRRGKPSPPWIYLSPQRTICDQFIDALC